MTVRSSNLRPARRPTRRPPRYELLDKAPVGARVTLARGAVEDKTGSSSRTAAAAAAAATAASDGVH